MSFAVLTIGTDGPPVSVTQIRGYADGMLMYSEDAPWVNGWGQTSLMGPGLYMHVLPTPSAHSFSIEVDWVSYGESGLPGGGGGGTTYSGTASDSVSFSVDNTPTISGVNVLAPGSGGMPGGPGVPPGDPGGTPPPPPDTGNLSGAVTLQAIAAPAGADQMSMADSDWIDYVAFYAGGDCVGTVLGSSATPVDPTNWWEGAQYQASQYFASWNTAELDENGDPKFPDGDYQVKAVAVAGASFKWTDPITVHVHNKGALSGHVYELGNGKPIKGATVTAYAWGGFPKGSATTDDGGAYRIELYPDMYYVEATHPNFVTNGALGSVAPQSETTGVDIELQRQWHSR